MIRPERPADGDAIHAVHCAAFPTTTEAHLVNRLRAAGKLLVSLVAMRDERIVGHIAFSPVTIAGNEAAPAGLGLGPLAVLPEVQRQGIGIGLVERGLQQCRDLGYAYAVVLGLPEYYPRFGFRPASDLGLGNEYGEAEAFMALELVAGSLVERSGTVRYCAEFAELA